MLGRARWESEGQGRTDGRGSQQYCKIQISNQHISCSQGGGLNVSLPSHCLYLDTPLHQPSRPSHPRRLYFITSLLPPTHCLPTTFSPSHVGYTREQQECLPTHLICLCSSTQPPTHLPTYPPVCVPNYPSSYSSVNPIICLFALLSIYIPILCSCSYLPGSNYHSVASQGKHIYTLAFIRASYNTSCKSRENLHVNSATMAAWRRRLTLKRIFSHVIVFSGGTNWSLPIPPHCATKRISLLLYWGNLFTGKIWGESVDFQFTSAHSPRQHFATHEGSIHVLTRYYASDSSIQCRETDEKHLVVYL